MAGVVRERAVVQNAVAGEEELCGSQSSLAVVNGEGELWVTGSLAYASGY